MIEKTCRLSGEKFIIEKDDLEFYVKMEIITSENLADLLSGKIVDCAGLPTLCPAERQRRRLMFRNERKLYMRKCDATGEKIMSTYHENHKFPVYKSSYWWSDKWDALDFGKDFDFSRPFFDQYEKLLNTVPKFQLIVEESRMENSPYTNACGSLKNCYLLFNADESEQCLYGRGIFRCFDCVDNLKIFDCEGCYELVGSKNCSFSTYLKNCTNTNDSHFGQNLIGCDNCFGCVNLRNKEYYFMNQSFSKESYEQKVSEIRKNHSLKELQKLFIDFVKKMPARYANVINSVNSDGNELVQTKNCKNCFECEKTVDCRYCTDLSSASGPNSNCYDVSIFGHNMDYCYESTVVGYGSNELKFCENSWGVSSLYYSAFCFNDTQNCFGCVGLKKKKYCILNKQYTKEEYEKLLPKIIEHMKKTGEWGEFFPTELSPFAYNETVAQEYFPLTKIEAEKRGYAWKEEKQTVQYTGPKYQIPDDISDVPDDIVDKVLQCERSEKFYRIQKAELKFYRKMNLPIPRLHPDERHKDRMALRNPRKLWSRNCGDCNCELQTTFAPERPEKILCEDCYLKVVD